MIAGELHAHHGAKPEVHPTAWVAPGAHLIGDVHIAEGASVWFGSVLRGDVCSISIGRFSNVQDNTVIHVESAMDGHDCNQCNVGEYVTIGHACIVHGCTIADRVLVGMGAVVMNRATIETECILGARALIAEDKVMPARSLVVGIPGKVVREVSEREAGFIRFSAEHYNHLAQSYLTS
ncbi:MAG: gamma carbonic anhydrase family protein [Chloroflexi bacterium]|nr:gamma carbonic anhydrase family protein [Chloroflexota bacterium]